jgi:hypothetical protein
MSDRNANAAAQYTERAENWDTRSLEPTGDADHDKLNQQSHNLDALDPLRNQANADANADALDDEEE